MCHVRFDTKLKIFLIRLINLSYITFRDNNRGADKFLARPTSRCIVFDDENISFDASLVKYIYSTNIPPVMIINRIFELQNLLSL
jgi:hypothetical protein